jgi:uncharacterized RDD family membrane protein YckC
MTQENQNQNLSSLGDFNPLSPNPSSPEAPVSQNPHPPFQPPQQTFVYRREAIAETQYASFWRRLAASFLDGIIINIGSFFIGLVFGFAFGFTKSLTSSFSSQYEEGLSSVNIILTFLISLICILISGFYYIYFIGAKGQTLGKMALNIKVVDEETNEAPGYLSAFLREVIGKFLSLFFFLGFLWVIWDKKKQGWHDKIAHTIVVKL